MVTSILAHIKARLMYNVLKSIHKHCQFALNKIYTDHFFTCIILQSPSTLLKLCYWHLFPFYHSIQITKGHNPKIQHQKMGLRKSKPTESSLSGPCFIFSSQRVPAKGLIRMRVAEVIKYSDKSNEVHGEQRLEESFERSEATIT